MVDDRLKPYALRQEEEYDKWMTDRLVFEKE